MNHAAQLVLSASPSSGPFHIPPGEWARPGLVDAVFVERSVAVMRGSPDSERRLQEDMAEKLESVRAIDLVYGNEATQWATATRERLWLECFTAEAILSRLKSATKCNEARQ